MTMKKLLSCAAVAATLATAGSAAAYTIDVNPYIGADYSYTDFDMRYGLENRYENNFNSLSLNAGVRINEIYGLEVYFQNAKTEKKAGRNDRFYSYGVDFVNYIPLNTQFELLGSLGLGEYTFKAGGNDDDTAFRIGVGAQYNFNELISARVMLRHAFARGDKMDGLNELSLGFRYNF